MQQEFSGIWVPVVTPFAPNGTVDETGLARLVRELARCGVKGFVACATTGEAATLLDAEKALVLHTVREAGAALPVVMGVSGVSPVDVARQCEHWRAAGAAGFLVPPPSYVRPSQQGLLQFYASVAAAARPLPIVVYDIPYRTGVELHLTTLRALAQIDGICALKDCGGDPRKTQALIADGQLQVLAGEDHQIFTTLCQGGSGAIAALFAEPNPAPLKAVLAGLGSIGADVRAPMTPASAAGALAAQRAYARVMAGCG